MLTTHDLPICKHHLGRDRTVGWNMKEIVTEERLLQICVFDSVCAAVSSPAWAQQNIRIDIT